jgi:hypothetical protein
MAATQRVRHISAALASTGLHVNVACVRAEPAGTLMNTRRMLGRV